MLVNVHGPQVHISPFACLPSMEQMSFPWPQCPLAIP